MGLPILLGCVTSFMLTDVSLFSVSGLVCLDAVIEGSVVEFVTFGDDNSKGEELEHWLE